MDENPNSRKNLYNSKCPNKKGFTITELVIVMAIIGVIFTISANTYRNQRIHTEFTDSLTKIVGMMKTARNYATTSRQVYDDGNLYIPEEGYGIYFEQNSTPGESKVILFANTSISGPDENADQYDDGDIIEEEYTLTINSVFEGIFEGDDIESLTPIGEDGDKAVVIFRPPLAETYIATNDDPSDISEDTPTEIDTLYLKFSRSGAPEDADKYIKINKIAGFPELEL